MKEIKKRVRTGGVEAGRQSHHGDVSTDARVVGFRFRVDALTH